MKKYHYTECGLNKVYLINGFDEIQSPYGVAVRIHDAEGLHKAIAKFLCKQSHLTGAGFRFLRKEMDLSQFALGKLLGVTDQAVAKWEKTGRVSKTADRFIRLLYLEKINGNVRVNDLVSEIADIDRKMYQSILVEETSNGWQPMAA